MPEDLGDESAGPWAPLPEQHSKLVLLTMAPVVTASQESQTISSDLKPTAADSSSFNSNSINSSSVTPPAVVVSEKSEKLESDELDAEDLNRDPTVHIVEPDEEAEMWEKVNERKISATLPPRPPRGSIPQAVSTDSVNNIITTGLI